MTSPAEKTGVRAIVLDTSALIAGFDPFSVSEELYTVPRVRQELSERAMTGLRFRTAVDSGKVKVLHPEKTFVEKTVALAASMGDSFFLSDTDIQILALALELKTQGYFPSIATDDYSIQNVAAEMDIGFSPLSAFGIRRRLTWTRYCPACHKTYPANYQSKTCRICGTKLKRKPSKTNVSNLKTDENPDSEKRG